MKKGYFSSICFSGRMNPIAKQLILGTKDPSSSLFKLRGVAKHLLRMIWEFFLRSIRGVINVSKEHVANGGLEYDCYASFVGNVKFPKPSSKTPINVNMIPFRLDDMNTLPIELRGYWGLIQSCPVPASRAKEVAYLTIQEGFVQKGKTQRRGGLHTEAALESAGMVRFFSFVE